MMRAILQKMVLKAVEPLSLFFLLSYTIAQAQNSISVHVQSVPSMKNAYSGMNFSEVGGIIQNKFLTDSTSGNGNTSLPNGLFAVTARTKNNYRFEDTVDINRNQNIDIQTIEDIPITSSYSTNIKGVVNTLKFNTENPTGGLGILLRWKDEDMPIPVYHENMPDAVHRAENDFAVNDLLVKTDSTIKSREVNTDSTVGILFKYIPLDSMPMGALGWTIVDKFYDDGSPKHVTILIAKDIDVSRGTFCREYGRALAIPSLSPDPSFVMYVSGPSQEFHPDEGHAIEIIYKLKNFTDMKKHKNIIDTTITGVRELKDKQPKGFKLEQNYPNPFNMSTNIKFSIVRSQLTILKVYNVLGREVATLVNEMKQPGEYTVRWDAKGVPSGVYYYRLTTGDFTSVKKMALVR
jgi:hypothetical protein